jgi:acetyltransferase
MLKRLTQLDYERDMAFVALDEATGEMAGIGRISCDPDKTMGEYALLVRSDLQGHGIGRELFQRLIDYARSEGIGRIEGFIHSDNRKMLTLSQELGFALSHHPDDAALWVASLEIAPPQKSRR